MLREHYRIVHISLTILILLIVFMHPSMIRSIKSLFHLSVLMFLQDAIPDITSCLISFSNSFLIKDTNSKAFYCNAHMNTRKEMNNNSKA